MNCPVCQQPCQVHLESYKSIKRFTCYCSQKESPNFICETFAQKETISSMYIHLPKVHLEYLGSKWFNGNRWNVYLLFPYEIIASGQGLIFPEEALILAKRFQNLLTFL
jgi:hypothetical protein